MTVSKPAAIILAAISLIVLPFLLRQSPQTRAAKRIREAVSKAEAPMRNPGGIPEIERFIADLKAVDLTDAPPSLPLLLSNYIAAAEQNVIVRRAQGDTNAANDVVAAAKRAFTSSTQNQRALPY